MLDVAWSVACLLPLSVVGWWLYGRYQERAYKSIPSIPLFPLVSYWNWLLTAYRQEYVREFILRILCAICVGADKFRIIMVWITFRPYVFFFKPEMVEALLNSSKTVSKSVEYRFLEPWLGTGLLTSSSAKWRSHRKLLSPAFHMEILDTFQATFDREATILTRKLTDGSVQNVVPLVTMCTLETICQTAMGVHLDAQSGGCKDYLGRIEQISESFLYRIFRPWLWNDFVFFHLSSVGRENRRNVDALQDFTKKIIKEKKDAMMREGVAPSDGNKRKAFLELLLEVHLTDESFTEENVREEVDTFMFEGHDTTAMCICWVLHLLGLHPMVQEKVYRELSGIFGEDNEREVTLEDLRQMKYLDCVVKETLRLYPSVFIIGRKLMVPLKIDEEKTLPAGCTCVVALYMLHRDPEQFPEPEVFDPDRFLPENACKRHPYAYLPFSAGPRNCIGQRFAMNEAKTVLTHMLRRFKVTSLDPRDKIRMLAGLVLKNLESIRIRFDLRRS